MGLLVFVTLKDFPDKLEPGEEEFPEDEPAGGDANQD